MLRRAGLRVVQVTAYMDFVLAAMEEIFLGNEDLFFQNAGIDIQPSKDQKG